MKIRYLSAGLVVGAMLVATSTSTAFAASRTSSWESGGTVQQSPTRTGGGGGSYTVLPAPSFIKSFSVSSNSVIGTASIETFVTGVITIKWGDGTRSVYDPSSPFPQSGISASSSRNVVFKHEYAVGSGQAVNYVVTAIVESGGSSDIDSRSLTVTPRWLVSQYKASFAASHCDTAVEEYTEWRVNQRADGTLINSWRFDVKTNSFPGASIGEFSEFRPLEGSIVQREMTMAQPALTVAYSAAELDEYFDDELGSKSIQMHPSIPPASTVLTLSGDDCRAQVKFDTDLLLLRPGAPGGTFDGGHTGGSADPIT